MLNNLMSLLNPQLLFGAAPSAASSSTQANGAAAGCDGGFTIIIVYVLIFGALYFFMIRPNSKKKKQEEELKKNVSVGDDITTIGGITGKVVAVRDEDDELIIETGADRVKMRMKRWCIYSNNTAIAAQEAEKKRLAEEKARQKAEKKSGKAKSEDKGDKNNQL